MRYKIPENYSSPLNILQTQLAIKTIKDYFQNALSSALNLHRVTAPLFVTPESGLNDNLSGIERPVSFSLGEQPQRSIEIVQSLAKWKRFALKKYGFPVGTGLYTDMNAIRRDEETDAIHSIYVDQWDWEKIIKPEQRSLSVLNDTVKIIYNCIKETELHVLSAYPALGEPILPAEITVISSQALEDKYPSLTSHTREYNAVKEYGAVFVTGIGGDLKSGEPHDKRSPDYDDWSLNGDIVIYNPVLDTQFELSSMGIRVDQNSLKYQLTAANAVDRMELNFQRALLNGELPQTIGGGIGQSRLCMFFLRKAHIGEVHCSVWRDETILEYAENGVQLL